jgi:hypothetical protein
MKKIFLIGLILVVASFASGCASYTVQTVPSQIDESKVVKAGDNDISITAFPILTEEDSKKYFDANLPGDKVMAIYLNVLNTSPDVVEVVASNLIIHSSHQQSIEPLPIEKAYKVVRREYAGKSTFWWFFGVYVGAPISAAHTASVNKDIEQDLQGKALNLGGINPKSSTYGFLWFKIPKEAMHDDKLPKGDLKISMKKNGKLIDYNLSLPEPKKEPD